MEIDPLDLFCSIVIIEKRVLLPAPLGPITPIISFDFIEKLTP